MYRFTVVSFRNRYLSLQLQVKPVGHLVLKPGHHDSRAFNLPHSSQLVAAGADRIAAHVFFLTANSIAQRGAVVQVADVVTVTDPSRGADEEAIFHGIIHYLSR